MGPIEKTVLVSFPGGARVAASMDGTTIETDQVPENGGEGSAPEPFQLFLASLAACGGIYAHRFLQHRGIDSSKVRMRLVCLKHSEKGLYRRMRFVLELPPDFPSELRAPLARAVRQCPVKKHMQNPPEFTVEMAGEVFEDS